MNKKQQCENYAKWIWEKAQTEVRHIGCKYGVGTVNNGSVIEWVTPIMDITQLLGYLQGLHMAKNNPDIFDKTNNY